MLRTLATCLLLLPLSSYAANTDTQPKTPIKHVIYITIDGVRWQDIFETHNNLPVFWQKYAKDAVIYGEPGSDKTMEVASVPISLPSYQSQMTGVVTECKHNECDKPIIETFPENLIKHGFKKADVASISCWEIMDKAFESRMGAGFANHGTRPMHDPYTYEIDKAMAVINHQQSLNYPDDDTRADKYVLDQSLHYFKKYKPKFLWISFGDADDYAHEGNKKKYQETIYFYDHAFDKIIKMVKSLKLYGETMIIITTDHGRGNGKNWIDHDETLPESKQTWAFVLHGKLENGKKDGNVEHFSTLSIRPTVEKAFGIS